MMNKCPYYQGVCSLDESVVCFSTASGENCSIRQCAACDFKEGELIIYHNLGRYEIGKIKRITDNGAFVWFSEGETAAKTAFRDMHKIINSRVITGTNLGGEA